jgi:hypothetical protein
LCLAMYICTVYIIRYSSSFLCILFNLLYVLI